MLTFEALPPRARSRAKLAIFDACGTALVGVHHPATRHLRQLLAEMGSAPQVRIIGDQSALLAAKGFTGDLEALETAMGWLELFRGADDSRAALVLADLGQDFALDRPELYFKLYPNGAPTHRFIDAALALRQHGIPPEQIARVVCRVNPTYVQTLRYPQPTTPQQARVSLQYAVAVALCDRQVALKQFVPSRVQAEDVQALMQRIELQADPTLSATAGSDFTAFPATVQIDLRDGRSITKTIEHESGSPQRPPTRPQFEAKFRECASVVLSAEQTLLAMRYLYQLDTLPTLRRLLDAMSLVPGSA